MRPFFVFILHCFIPKVESAVGITIGGIIIVIIFLDDAIAETHWVLGNVYLWKKQHEQAVIELEKGIAINPNSAAFLHLHFKGRGQNQAIDELQRLGLDAFDVLLQGRLPGKLLIDAKTTESAKAPRVGQVESQLLVAVAVHLLEDHKT